MHLNSALATELSQIDQAAGPVYAVLDGAQFDNLPVALRQRGLHGRALYVNASDQDSATLATAPHLVWLDAAGLAPSGSTPNQTIPELLDLLGEGAGAVFWRCPAGAEALFRHLRGLNMVMIPNKAAGADHDGPTMAGDRSHSMVLFRHADANVMAQVCPALGIPELRRLMGPADLLFARPSWDWYPVEGVLRQQRPDALPAKVGPLRLEAAHIDHISAYRFETDCDILVAEIIPAIAPPAQEKRLRAALRRAAQYALTERDQMRSFAHMDLQHGAEFEHFPAHRYTLEHLTDPQLSSAMRLAFAQSEMEMGDLPAGLTI